MSVTVFERSLDVLFNSSAGQMLWLTVLLAVVGGHAWATGHFDLFRTILDLWLLRMGLRQAQAPSAEAIASLVKQTVAKTLETAKPQESV